MKQTIIKELVFIIMFCILSGCGKTEIPQTPTDGEAIALFNGQECKMPARAGGRNNRLDTIGIGIGNVSDPNGRGLAFHNILKKLGKQFLFLSTVENIEWFPVLSYYTNSNDPQITCDTYEILETDSTDNWVEIIQESNNYKEIWGNFSITLIRTTTCNGSQYPDTIHLRNGSFHIWNVK